MHIKKRIRGKRGKKSVKKVAKKLIFSVQASRNNVFVNILDLKGCNLFRSSGGKICYIRGLTRRAKRSKDIISFILLHVRAFLTKRTVVSVGFIFRVKFVLSRFFFFRVLEILRKKKKKLK